MAVWLDATYLKQREGGRIVSVAVIIAVAANTEGKREIVGLPQPCGAQISIGNEHSLTERVHLWDEASRRQVEVRKIDTKGRSPVSMTISPLSSCRPDSSAQ
jgi:hypothetical protein